MSFEIDILKYTKGVTNVLHFTADDAKDSPGHKIPSVDMYDARLRISFPNGESTIHHDIQVTLNETMEIKIRQQWSMENAVNTKIFLGDVEIFSKRNPNPKSYKNVRCYIGNPWQDAAHVIIKNLTYERVPYIIGTFIQFYTKSRINAQ